MSGGTDTGHSSRNIHCSTLLCVGDAQVRKLDCGTCMLHQLLKTAISLTDDKSMMMWRNVDGNSYYQWLANSTQHVHQTRQLTLTFSRRSVTGQLCLVITSKVNQEKYLINSLPYRQITPLSPYILLGLSHFRLLSISWTPCIVNYNKQQFCKNINYIIKHKYHSLQQLNNITHTTSLNSYLEITVQYHFNFPASGLVSTWNRLPCQQMSVTSCCKQQCTSTWIQNRHCTPMSHPAEGCSFMNLQSRCLADWLTPLNNLIKFHRLCVLPSTFSELCCSFTVHECLLTVKT